VRFSSVSRLAASLSAVFLAVPAFAADLPSSTITPAFTAPPEFTVIIGVGPEVTPSFPGAKSFIVLPSVHVAYLRPGEHDFFYSPDDSFDIAILNTGIFRAGPAGNFVNRRGLSGGNGQFNGLPNVDDSVELGGFAEIWPLQGHLRIRGEILKAVSGYDGLVGTIGADLIGRFGPFQLAAGPRVKFGDQRFADSYFTITPAAAAINGLVTPYQATGGLTSAGLFASARYDVTQNIAATVFGGWDYLESSVGASPVATVLGNRNQFTGGVTLSYAFGFKGFGVFGY
jgi:outer membrane scaffolding protein for murein synthesis (MipA/OmpV family)